MKLHCTRTAPGIFAKLVQLVITLCPLVALAASTSGSEPARLRVMTFNIHHGRGADGKINLPRIAETIKAARVDLVALQEVDRETTRSDNKDQLRELSELTDLHHAFGKSIEFGGGEYGVAILSRYAISSSKTFRLPSSDDREQRVALEVKVHVPEFSPLVFVSTHLDHYADERDRMAQASKLIELFSHGPGAAIVAGDLNAVPHSDVLRALRQHWQMTDASRLQFTSPAETPRAKIDYVLFPNDSPWKVVSTEVLDDRTSSDHLALVAEFASREE